MMDSHTFSLQDVFGYVLGIETITRELIEIEFFHPFRFER